MTWPTEQARDAAAGALRKSRLTWGTHSDRWGDTPWQRDFWGEAADTVLDALAPHVEALVRAERAAALREAAEAWLRGAWGDTPRHADRVADRMADRMAASQYAGDWLRARAEAEEAGR